MSGFFRLKGLAPAAFATASILCSSGLPAVATATIEPTAQTGQSDGGQPASLSGIEALVDDAMAPVRRGAVAGAVVAVVKDGQVLVLKGYGYADVAKGLQVDPATTLFRIGSITKTFTWVALTQLMANGKVGLDQPIDELLPSALQPDSRHYEGAPILVRHLLTHTAGFEDKVLYHFFLRDPAQVRSLSQELSQYKPKRIRPPGIAATYSNYCAALAGAIIEHVSGEPYADYLDSHVLVPLQMASTTAREPLGDGTARSMSSALAGRLSRGYIDVDGKLEARPCEYLSQVGPAGSISSTGADMARYMLARLSPGVILSPESEAQMQSQLFANDKALSGIGYGWMLSKVGQLQTVWHDGGTMAFHSNLVLVPSEHLGIFISTNSSTGGGLANNLPKAILTKYFAAARIEPTTTSLSPKILKDYQGTYLGDRLSTSTAERFFLALIAKTIKVEVRSGALAINGLRIAAIGPDVFTTESGEVLVFHRDDVGRVSELKTVVESFRRLPVWRTPLFLAVLCVLTVLLSVVNCVMGWRHVRTADAQRSTSKLFLGASLGWLLYVGCIVGAIVQMTRSPLDVVFLYPPIILTVGMWLGVCNAILSIAATASALRFMALSTWRLRIQYAVSIILWTTLMLALYDWQLLGLSA